MENEFVVLSQKRHLAAIGCAALRLVLRALIEAAESAEMRAGGVDQEHVDQEHVDLMVGDADLPFLPEQIHRVAAQEA
jgi:hypothetical protein